MDHPMTDTWVHWPMVIVICALDLGLKTPSIHGHENGLYMGVILSTY